MPEKIAVIGAGSWGSALAMSLAERHPVALWGRSLPRGVDWPPALTPVTQLAPAVAGADLVLLAVPTTAVDGLLQALATTPPANLLWVSKGIVPGTGQFIHQRVAHFLPALPAGVLSGPSFAAEVAEGKPAALTLASSDAGFARLAAGLVHGRALRIYTSDDVIGVEVAGAVKNVLAIAAGISDGLGLGLNARAALITRGLAECSRLGLALGGRNETFMGLSGVGDLILTCTGDLSRNRRVGLALARGSCLEAALADLGQVAEGVETAREVRSMAARLGVPMPIVDVVCRVLHEGLTPVQAVDVLLSRQRVAEHSFDAASASAPSNPN